MRFANTKMWKGTKYESEKNIALKYYTMRSNESRKYLRMDKVMGFQEDGKRADMTMMV